MKNENNLKVQPEIKKVNWKEKKSKLLKSTMNELKEIGEEITNLANDIVKEKKQVA